MSLFAKGYARLSGGLFFDRQNNMCGVADTPAGRIRTEGRGFSLYSLPFFRFLLFHDGVWVYHKVIGRSAIA